ncbi:MAG TPA: hypothetical protein VI793_00535 [Anaerolineales bacterium]|nr:hypothetical protein [Anaerolineales bacterium]
MTTHSEARPRVHWLLWPFWALWQLVAGILLLTGRFVAILLGVVFIIVGLLVSLTIVGAIIGIPLALFGVLLVVRGLW